MTVTRETEMEIRRLHEAERWRVGTIAAQLGVHHDVVRRVLGLLPPPKRASVRQGPALDPFADFIAKTLDRYPTLRATRLHDMLTARGYKGSPRSLRRYVATVRPRPRKEAFLHLHPLVGEQAQVDWAHVAKVPVPGGVRSLWLFVMVLAWSRGMWAEFVYDTTVHSLLRSLVRACAYFGGSCRQWLFDNAKAVVLQRHGNAVRFNPLLLELAGTYHAQLRVCAPYRGNQKGRVERMIRYLRERFLSARTIHSVEQGNRQLERFLDDIAHQRPHPTQRERTVGACLDEERSHLLPLPVASPPVALVTPVNVDKTGFVRFDRNRYSAPPEHAGTVLTLVADDTEVRLLSGKEVVATHQRCWGRCRQVVDPAHQQELVRRKRAARASTGRDRLRQEVPGIDPLFGRWVEAGRNVGSMTARTLKLLDLYGGPLLTEAVAEALARGTSDPGALAQLCEQHRTRKHMPVPLDIDLGEHVPDREVIPHDLEQYDAKP